MRAFSHALLAAILVAGCVTPPATEDDPEASASRTMTWSIEGCTAAVAVVPVPASALQAHLPEGFRLLTPEEAGLPPDPRGDAVLGLEAFECDRAVANGNTTEEAPHGGIFSFVEPPPELVDPDVDFFTFFRWDTALAAPELRAFFADAGAPVYEGTASVTTATMPEAGGPLRASLEVNGTSFVFTGGSQGTSGGTGGVFDEYFSTPNGLAKWKTQGVAPFGQGAGTIQATGGLAEEVLGSEPVPGYVLFLTGVSFTNGTATVP